MFFPNSPTSLPLRPSGSPVSDVLGCIPEEVKKMKIKCVKILCMLHGVDYLVDDTLMYKQDPAPDGHRCGMCPTYIQKICAFDPKTKSTHIFDNHCIMDSYNCIEETEFAPMNYDQCLYYGNFASVHGFKYEDEDY